MAAHAYWRLWVPQGGSVGGSEVAITELEMYDADGNALCSGGTASESSYYSGYPGSSAFDGNYSNAWNCAYPAVASAEQWVAYHFANAVDVAAVRIVNTWSTSKGPKDLKIQYSDDGSAWTDAAGPFSPSWDVSLRPAWSFPIGTPNNGSYSAWRLRIRNAQSSTWACCAELELRGASGGADLTTNVATYAICADTTNGSYLAGNAFDNSASTSWNTGNISVSTQGWFGYCFPIPKAVIELAFTTRNDSYYAQGPDAVWIEGSNDCGATWTTVAIWVPADWTQGLTQVFNWGYMPSPSASPVWGVFALSPGTVGAAYDSQWYLEGCATPTEFTCVGELPDGLTLANLDGGSEAGGHIFGTPTTAGTYNFTLRATNANGTADKAFSITIEAAPSGGGGGEKSWVWMA